MISNDGNKTLREEIAEAIAAEIRVAAELKQQQEKEQRRVEAEARLSETPRALEIIAGIREKVLAPDRAKWKPLMTLTESEVFVPDTYNDSDILLVGEAAKQVRDYCRENGIKVMIVAERRDGQYSIHSATGRYIMNICV